MKGKIKIDSPTLVVLDYANNTVNLHPADKIQNALEEIEDIITTLGYNKSEVLYLFSATDITIKFHDVH